MKTYEYKVLVVHFPLPGRSMDELGADGWLLTGAVKCTTLATSTEHPPYEAEEFWYYFVKEVTDENLQSK